MVLRYAYKNMSCKSTQTYVYIYAYRCYHHHHYLAPLVLLSVLIIENIALTCNLQLMQYLGKTVGAVSVLMLAATLRASPDAQYWQCCMHLKLTLCHTSNACFV
jgi:hypothetical protein